VHDIFAELFGTILLINVDILSTEKVPKLLDGQKSKKICAVNLKLLFLYLQHLAA